MICGVRSFLRHPGQSDRMQLCVSVRTHCNATRLLSSDSKICASSSKRVCKSARSSRMSINSITPDGSDISVFIGSEAPGNSDSTTRKPQSRPAAAAASGSGAADQASAVHIDSAHQAKQERSGSTPKVRVYCRYLMSPTTACDCL